MGDIHDITATSGGYVLETAEKLNIMPRNSDIIRQFLSEMARN
jgi:hypothetical protein